MTAPSFYTTSYSTAASETSASTQTLAAPTGITAGMQLVSIVSFRQNTAGSVFTGISNSFSITNQRTEIGGAFRIGVAQKTSAGSEGSTVWTMENASNRRVSALFGISGANGAGSLSFGSTVSGDSTPHTLPSITTVVDNCLIVYLVYTRAILGATSLTASAGSTDLTRQILVPGATGTNAGLAVLTVPAPTAGTYSDRQVDWGTDGSGAHIIAAGMVFEPVPSGDVSGDIMPWFTILGVPCY